MSKVDISHIDFNKKRRISRTFTLPMYPEIDCTEYDDGVVLKRSGHNYEYKYSLAPTPAYNYSCGITKEQYDLVRSNEVDEVNQ